MKRRGKKKFRKISLALIIGLTCYLSIVIFTPYSSYHLERSISNQINHISLALASGEDIELQKRYPEGYVFANAIFALALIEYGEYNNVGLIDSSIKKLLSDTARSTFDAELSIPHGAFYNGWVGFVLNKYIQSPLFEYSSIVQDVVVENFQIGHKSKSFQKGQELFPTYEGQIWPADNLIYAVALDTSFQNKIPLYNRVHNFADSLQLIYHYLDEEPLARGSSQALITYLISESRSEVAQEYNERYLSQFESSFLGIDFIKEYQDGRSIEDVDSGPIICGIGSVATIMNIKTQSNLGNDSRVTWAALNLAGLPINTLRKKRYLFGKELMFDLFMLWTSVDFTRDDH